MNTITVKKERNYGLDLLRIVSMYMVVVIHIVGAGGVIEGTQQLSLKYGIAWFLEIASFCAVNCYALISGYVGLKSKHRFSNIAMLWLQVAFYSAGIAAILYFFGKCNLRDVIKSFTPVTSYQYWYFCAYFAMWFFIPLMNAAVENLSATQLKRILLASGIVLSFVSTVADAFSIGGGYSVVWLSYLYLLGAYAKKTDCFQGKSAGKYFLVYLGAAFLTLVSKYVLVKLGKDSNLLIAYVSPTIILSSVALFVVCLNLNIREGMRKIISFISPMTFGVYLIHIHPLLFAIAIKSRFSFVAEFSPLLLTGAVLGLAFAVFIGCILVDYLRKLIFDLFRIRKLLMKLEERWIHRFSNVEQ